MLPVPPSPQDPSEDGSISSRTPDTEFRPIDYCVCEQKSAEGLASEVVGLLRRGWRPVGGVSVVQVSMGDWWYFQAMMLGGAGDEHTT